MAPGGGHGNGWHNGMYLVLLVVFFLLLWAGATLLIDAWHRRHRVLTW
jgi:hypothetical protein